RRVSLDRDDVWPGRHHLTDACVAEIHDRLKERAPVSFDQSLLLARLEVGMGALALLFFILLVGGNQSLGTAARQEADEPAGNRGHDARDDAERREERRQYCFGIAPDNERRQ